MKNGIMRSPAVSVIVPAYNVTEYIAETLASLRTQTFRDFETVVVNDGCPDTANLERAIEPYRGEITYIKQKNGGLANARNTAIRSATAPLVALLDSDDIWEPDYLAVQTSLVESHPEADVIYPNALFFGDTYFPGKTVMDLYPSSGEVTFQSLLRLECRVFVGVTARREALVRAGLFDPELRSAEDLDMWLRLAQAGSRFFYHSRPLVRYRARANNLSNDPVWMTQSVLRVYEKLGRALNLAPDDRAALESALCRERANLDFYLGKKALYARNRAEALERLGRANEVLCNRKVSAALLALRFAPSLLYRCVHRLHPTEYTFMH
jgi:glycosyltransferase involved in cell wall biosynthesis